MGANNVYDVVVRASDGTLTRDQSIAVTITNVNEAPIDIYAVNNVTDTNVLGYYSFSSANNLGRDDAGDNQSMTLFGSPTQTTRAGGSGAIDFAGGASGQYGNIASMTTGGAMTIASWVKFDSTSAGGWERVVDFGQSNAGGIGSIVVSRGATTNNLSFTIEKAGFYTYRATAFNAITNGTWMHFAATVDSSGNMALYVNGTLAGTTVGAAPDIGVRTNHFVGKSNFTADGAFDGAIDDLIITNGAMSAASVAALYQQSAGYSIAENSANGTLVGTALTSDPDASNTYSYSLTNNAGGRFAINSTTGNITVANSSLLNFEANTSHSIVVQTTDQGGLSFSKTFTIAVTDVNDAPTAVADAATALEAGGVSNATAGSNPTGNVLTNDTDADAVDTKTVSGVAAGTVASASGSVGSSVTGSYGSISIGSNGAYTYTVDNTNVAVQALRTTSNTLADVFTYTMRDTAGLTSTTQITVTIQGANDAPADIALVGNSGTNLVTNGSFETNNGAANNFTYGASTTATGWTAIGGEGVEVWNNFTNGGPVAASNGNTMLELDVTWALNGISQNITTTSGQKYVLSFDLSGRSTSPSSSVEVYWQNQLIGTITNSAVGWNTYSFVVTGSGGSDNLRFMELASENDGVGSLLDNVRLIADQSSSITVAENSVNGTVVARAGTSDWDSVSADTINYSLTNSSSGAFAINATTGVITVANSSLLDFETTPTRTIVVRATDTVGATLDRTFTIGLTNVNEAPVGVNDTATAVEAGGVSNGTAGTNPTGNVLTNDTDIDAGDTRTVSAVVAGAQATATGGVASSVTGTYGSINVAANGAYTYTVDNSNASVQALRLSSQTLQDVFTYRVSDAGGLTSLATITVTIQGANDTPTAVADTATAVEAGGVGNGTAGTNPTGNVLTNDTDPDSVGNGETKTVTGVLAGTQASATGNVASSVTGTYGSINIAANGAYTYTVDNSNPTVQALRTSGQTITDVFTYTMTDTAGSTSTTQITVSIQGANDAPTAVADTVTAVEAGGVGNGTAGTNPTGNVLTNDTDPDSVGNGETKTVTGVLSGTQASATGNVASSVTGTYGSINIAANGAYTYTVDNSNATVQALRTSGQTITDVFTYTMTDAAGSTSTTQITVTIQGANDAPTAVADTATAVEAGGVGNGTAGTNPTGNVLTNDTDPDSVGNGETKTVTGVLAGTQASATGNVASSVTGTYGSINIAANGAYTYTVDNTNATVQALRTSGQTITDVFTYTMTDTAGRPRPHKSPLPFKAPTTHRPR